MDNVKLKYNPYTRDRELVINGNKESDTSKYCGADDKELSEWCNIDFFERLFGQLNDNFCIEFTGIDRDYEFLEKAKKDFVEKKRNNVKVELKTGHLYSIDAKLEDFRELFNRMQKETPYEVLRDDSETGKALKENFEKTTNSEFEMAVIATMSSGKSTLINALLGKELLPARNEATTATISRIHDDPNAKDFSATSYDSYGNIIDSVNPLTSERMEKLNNEKIAEVDIYGHIKGIDSKNIRLVLTDTPGPNNSSNQKHHEHTYKLLKADYKPMILYVLNGTQLETNDDYSLLHDVAEAMNDGDKQSRDRFIFILNKADEFDPGKGELISDKLDKAKKYLERFGIKDARVFPCSSMLAKLIRQKQNNDSSLTEQESIMLPLYVQMFINEKRKHFSDYADFLSPSTKDDFNKEIEKAKKSGDKLNECLYYTGVPAVEFAISEYLTKYAIPAKISQGVSLFKKKIDDLNVEADDEITLSKDKSEVEKRKKELEEISKIIEKGEKAENLKLKIDSFSVDDHINEKYINATSKFINGYNSVSDPMKDSKLAVDMAKENICILKKTIPNMVTKFRVDVVDIISEVFTYQAEQCVNEYKNYVESLVGKVDVTTKPAAIFGGVSTISISDVLSDFEKVEHVKVGEHTVRNSDYHWYDGLFNLFRSVEKEKYITYEDWEDRTYIDFVSFLNEKVVPIIGSYEQETRKIMDKEVQRLQCEFKQSFKNKFDQLDNKIREKVQNKKAVLQDTAKFEEEIKKTEKNLNWIKSFKKELNKLLSLGD